MAAVKRWKGLYALVSAATQFRHVALQSDYNSPLISNSFVIWGAEIQASLNYFVEANLSEAAQKTFAETAESRLVDLRNTKGFI